MFGRHKSQQREWKMRLKVRLGVNTVSRGPITFVGEGFFQRPSLCFKAERCRLKARRGEGILKMMGLG